MKNRTKVVAALTFALGGTVIAFAQQQSFTGVVTDSMCGATHMAKDKTPAECTRMCEGRHEVRAGRGQEALHVGRT